MSARRTAGFTLVEMVLAVGLVIAVAAGAYAFYLATFSMRDSARREGEVIFAQRRILDLMADELRSATVFSRLQMSLTGGYQQGLSFSRAVVPSHAVFVAPGVVDAESIIDAADPDAGLSAYEPQHDVQLIGYRLYRYEDEDGVEQIGGLLRTSQRTVTAPTAEEGKNIEVTLLSRQIRFLYVRYWDGQAWTPSWSDAGALPTAVRIDLGTEPLPEDEDLAPDEYPYETVWRVVALPTGGGTGGGGRGGAGGRGSADDEGAGGVRGGTGDEGAGGPAEGGRGGRGRGGGPTP